MITFIITSYNRPKELQALLDSLWFQTSQDFETIIVDDNSSDPLVREIIDNYFDGTRKGVFATSDVRDDERQNTVRYAANINLILGLRDEVIHGDVIAYLCDDVELARTYVEVVNKHFAEHPDCNAGYVAEEWTMNGYRTNLLWYDGPMRSAFCALDHSQVIHRTEFAVVWPTHPLAWKFADGIAFERLLGAVGEIEPIGNSRALVNNKILPTSVCRQDIESALAKLRVV